MARSANFLTMIRNEETVYKIVDAAINYFAEHAKTRERLSKMFERLGTNEFQEYLTNMIKP